MRKSLLLFLIFSIAQAVPGDAGSLLMDYGAWNNISIEHLTIGAGLINLTQEIYLYAQDVEYVKSDFSYFNVTTSSEGGYFTYIHEGDADSLYWDFNARILKNRTVMRLSEASGFPLSPELIPEEVKDYLEFSEYIDYDPLIIDKANELVEGVSGLLKAVMNLAEWVANNIEYTPTMLYLNGTQKASFVYDTGKGVCDELSVLFMSMARSVGIPVRYSNGYAYTNLCNDFGSHAWVEVWLPSNEWMPVDLTYDQFGWLDPYHIKMYGGVNLTRSFINTKLFSVDQSSLVISNELPEFLSDSLSTCSEGFITVIDETPESVEFTGSLSLSKAVAGEDDYALLTLSVYNPTNYYIPLSYQVITTQNMSFVSGYMVNAVILKPNNYTVDYVILKTPVLGNSVSHPITVKLPGMEELNISLSVDPSFKQRTSLEELELQIASEESVVTDLRVTSVAVNPVISYNNSASLRFSVRNMGTKVLEDVSINIVSSLINPLNLTIPRVRINEEVSVDVELASIVDYGEDLVMVYASINNQTTDNSTELVFAKKPGLIVSYKGPVEFKSTDALTFQLLFNKTDRITVSGIDLMISTGSWSNNYSFEMFYDVITINASIDVIGFGNDTFDFVIDYYDAYGTKFTKHLTQGVVKTGEWWELIINWFIELFNSIINFVSGFQSRA